MLTISGYKRTDRQLKLWSADAYSPPLRGHGHVRNVLGEIAEAATVDLLTTPYHTAKRHKTQGNVDYCPDVSIIAYGHPIYYECKSAGLSNQTFIYAGRLERDRKFANLHDLYYVIWHHAVDTLAAVTEADLRQQFYETLRGVYVVPFANISLICRSLKVEKLNSHYGNSINNAKVYGSGYRLPVKSLSLYSVKHNP